MDNISFDEENDSIDNIEVDDGLHERMDEHTSDAPPGDAQMDEQRAESADEVGLDALDNAASSAVADRQQTSDTSNAGHRLSTESLEVTRDQSHARCCLCFSPPRVILSVCVCTRSNLAPNGTASRYGTLNQA